MTAEVRDLEALAMRVRLARESVESRRVALGRYALVWWEGVAADRYRELVDDRRAALGRLIDELASLEESVAALAALARVEAAFARVEAGPLRAVGRAS